MTNVYEITKAFESKLCEYTGAPFAVAVDNMSNALFLALMYEKLFGKWEPVIEPVSIPNRTYPSVPCEIIHAGGKVKFEPISGMMLTGPYQLKPTKVWDCALRFTRGMYRPEQHQCISFTGPRKHLKLSKGGAILTDDKKAYEWFKRARYSGRNEVDYHNDEFTMLGWNMYLMPELAARGLLLLQAFPDHNEDLSLFYPDLSKFRVYHQ